MYQDLAFIQFLSVLCVSVEYCFYSQNSFWDVPEYSFQKTKILTNLNSFCQAQWSV